MSASKRTSPTTHFGVGFYLHFKIAREAQDELAGDHRSSLSGSDSGP